MFSIPKAQAALAKQVALGFSLACVVYIAILGFTFNTKAGAPRFQFTGSWRGSRAFGVHMSFGMDGIALVLVAMAVILVPAVILASWNAFESVTDAEEIG